MKNKKLTDTEEIQVVLGTSAIFSIWKGLGIIDWIMSPLNCGATANTCNAMIETTIGSLVFLGVKVVLGSFLLGVIVIFLAGIFSIIWKTVKIVNKKVI